MTEKTKAKMPEPLLATQDYVLMINTDTERRIETAFRDQTMYVGNKIESLERTLRDQMRHSDEKFEQQHRESNQRFEAQNRWLIGLAIVILLSMLSAALPDLFQ